MRPIHYDRGMRDGGVMYDVPPHRLVRLPSETCQKRQSILSIDHERETPLEECSPIHNRFREPSQKFEMTLRTLDVPIALPTSDRDYFSSIEPQTFTNSPKETPVSLQ